MQKDLKNYGDLLAALQEMTPEQLQQKVLVLNGDEPQSIKIDSISEIGEDMYVNKHDDEDGGPLQELKELHGDEFVESDYELSTPKETIFLFAEF